MAQLIMLIRQASKSFSSNFLQAVPGVCSPHPQREAQAEAHAEAQT